MIVSDIEPIPVIKTEKDPQYVFTISFDINYSNGQWSYNQINLPLGKWDKDTIIKAIINFYYSDEDTTNIINNALQNPANTRAIITYKNLQKWREQATAWAEELLEYAYNNGLSYIDPNETMIHYNNPKPEGKPEWFTMVNDGLKLLQKQALTLTDEEACDVPTLFPAWVDLIGEEVLLGERLYYNGDLWKVLQTHTVIEEDNPYGSPELYLPLTTNSGTEEYPIPRQYAVDFEDGKTYSDGKQLYIGLEVSGEVDLVAIKGGVPLIP